MNVPELRALRSFLARELRHSAFGPSEALRRRVGAEVEVIPVDAVTQRPAALSRTAAMLNELAARHGWCTQVSTKGAPTYVLPDGARLTFEPGGQVEYSSVPFDSASRLLRAVRPVMRLLHDDAAQHGLELLSVGLDPLTPASEATRQIEGERYGRMEAYFATIGGAGARMMRQTASLQLCIDAGSAPRARWRLLNAMAPLITAMFANSPLSAGEPVGTPSARAQVWRTLDPARTGILPGVQAAEEYVDMALAAPDMMRPCRDGSFLPFAQLVALRGFDRASWRTHLSTLFMDVRPRGYFEVRSCDAIPTRWHAAPLVLICGAILHEPSARAAADLLGSPNPDLLERASRSGLADSTIVALARDLCGIAIDGCHALGEAFIAGEDLAVAEEYFARYTAVASSPADDMLAELHSAAA